MSRLIDLLARLIAPKPAPAKPTPKPTPVPAPTPTIGDDRDAFLALLDRERAKAGKPPTVADPRLDALAQGWADWMDRMGTEYHGDFEGRMDGVYPNTAAAENIDIAPTVAAAFAAWMASTGHRTNMLGPYNRVGLGRSGLYWCADFARV